MRARQSRDSWDLGKEGSGTRAAGRVFWVWEWSRLGYRFRGFPMASRYCVPLPFIMPFYATKLQFPESNRRIVPLLGLSLPSGPMGIVVSKTK